MIYLAIVDDKKNLSFTLKERLNNIPEFEVLFTAENGKVFLEEMKKANLGIQPDVVLMDIDMPIMNGIDAVTESKLRFPRSKYLMLTIFDEDEKIFNAIKAGANGYLLKDEPIEKIIDAIKNLMKEEGAPMSPSIARKVLNLLTNPIETKSRDEHSNLQEEYKLTDREKEILLFLVEGFEYKEIAEKLRLSPNTIRNTVAKIYTKLHVTSRMQAVKVVNRNNS